MTVVNFREIERKTYSDMIEGKNVHDDIKTLSVEELKASVDSDRLPFDVMAFNLTGDGNIGSIVRSSILHGASKVIVFGRRVYDRRSSVGAENYIDVERIDGFVKNTADFSIDAFKSIIDRNSYFPVFIEQGGTHLQDFDWKVPTGKRMLLVVGNETNGIPNDVMTSVDGNVVSIPQRGVIRSFNVANAMNIATWDMRVKRNWI